MTPRWLGPLLMLLALALASCEPEAVSTTAGAPPEIKPDAMIVGVRLNDDQTASIDDATFTFDELRTHLKTESATIDGVRLEVSTGDSHADVVSVLEALKHAGIESVIFSEPDQSESVPGR